MTRVFISYRRDDSADITGRIFDRLRTHFDEQIIFRDVDVIPFGSDFPQVIRRAVEDCQVLLAVIGPNWLTTTTRTGIRRLDDPADFVRLEIETALKRDIPVIPVLVGKATMPEAIHLPDSLQPLVFRNGLDIGRDPYFHRDVDTLIRGLTGILNPTPPPASAPPPFALPRSLPSPAVMVSCPEAGDHIELILPGNLLMVFAWCPPGTFLMGNEKGYATEKPVHRVTLTKGFYLGMYPVTQAQWTAVIGGNPSHFKGDTCPVECVTWDGAEAFTAKLTEMTGKPIRLPSEGEWEYACRAGTSTEYHAGDGEVALKNSGWYRDNSDSQTHPVGELAANAWGFYDMHGNVWEWCQDWYGPYKKGEQTDPQGPANGNSRILRGGAWNGLPDRCCAAYRTWFAPAYCNYGDGFRVAFHLD